MAVNSNTCKATHNKITPGNFLVPGGKLSHKRVTLLTSQRFPFGES